MVDSGYIIKLSQRVLSDMFPDQQRELWQHKVFSVQHTPLSVSAYFVRVMPTFIAFFPVLPVWKEKVAFGMNRTWFKP